MHVFPLAYIMSSLDAAGPYGCLGFGIPHIHDDFCYKTDVSSWCYSLIEAIVL
tara:strand:- start:799 stop:957 length:159 start_codon:yes stop_codon:yes gene_type:complete